MWVPQGKVCDKRDRGTEETEEKNICCKEKGDKKEIETIQEKIVSESVKECEEDRILEEEKSEEKRSVKKN